MPNRMFTTEEFDASLKATCERLRLEREAKMKDEANRKMLANATLKSSGGE